MFLCFFPPVSFLFAQQLFSRSCCKQPKAHANDSKEEERAGGRNGRRKKRDERERREGKKKRRSKTSFLPKRGANRERERARGPFYFSFLHTETRVRWVKGRQSHRNQNQKEGSSRESSLVLFPPPFLLSSLSLPSLSRARDFFVIVFFHLFISSLFPSFQRKSCLAVVREDRLLGLGEFLFLFSIGERSRFWRKK